jgi:RES domain
MARRPQPPAIPPSPPPWLASARLPIQELTAGTQLHRIYRRSDRLVFFGPGPGRPPTHRFDAPNGEFGVIYTGLDFTAAFVETLLRNPEMRVIDLVDLEIRDAAILTAARPLRLVRAYGAGLSGIGCTAALSTARYSLSGAWSRALWAHKDAPDGLIYHSRHNPEHLCAAIFNRRGLVLRVVRTRPLLADPATIANILDTHGKSVALR